MTQRSPDPQADRFLDNLLAETKKTREAGRAARAAAVGEEVPNVPGLSEAVEEVAVPETIKTLLDEPDPVAAIGKVLRAKTLRGV